MSAQDAHEIFASKFAATHTRNKIWMFMKWSNEYIVRNFSVLIGLSIQNVKHDMFFSGFRIHFICVVMH